jgi:hypothetical protein
MKVQISGPNLRDQSRGQFHIHAVGCRDLQRTNIEPEYAYGWPVEATTKREVVEAIYDDHMAEHADDPTDRWGTWEPYLEDLYFFPCTKELK